MKVQIVDRRWKIEDGGQKMDDKRWKNEIWKMRDKRGRWINH